jgi:hypothetical protein
VLAHNKKAQLFYTLSKILIRLRIVKRDGMLMTYNIFTTCVWVCRGTRVGSFETDRERV